VSVRGGWALTSLKQGAATDLKIGPAKYCWPKQKKEELVYNDKEMTLQ
jgi:hypothetical protein